MGRRNRRWWTIFSLPSSSHVVLATICDVSEKEVVHNQTSRLLTCAFAVGVECFAWWPQILLFLDLSPSQAMTWRCGSQPITRSAPSTEAGAIEVSTDQVTRGQLPSSEIQLFALTPLIVVAYYAAISRDAPIPLARHWRLIQLHQEVRCNSSNSSLALRLTAETAA